MKKPLDTIYHTTLTKPKFIDRVKILLGATIIVDSEIHVDVIVSPIYSTAKDAFVFERIDRAKRWVKAQLSFLYLNIRYWIKDVITWIKAKFKRHE